MLISSPTSSYSTPLTKYIKYGLIVSLNQHLFFTQKNCEAKNNQPIKKLLNLSHLKANNYTSLYNGGLYHPYLNLGQVINYSGVLKAQAFSLADYKIGRASCRERV